MAIKKQSPKSPTAKKKLWSIYDENGDVTAEAQQVLADVFYEYKPFSPREEQCRKMVWDQAEEGMTAEEFKQLCIEIKDFDMDDEGPLDENSLAVLSENNEVDELPDDPKILVFHTWVEFFRQELEPFPKKKKEQAEWVSRYGNFYYVCGWALMQFKEEHRDWEWTKWRELSSDELVQLASDFANFIFQEDLAPILRAYDAQLQGGEEV